MLDPQRRDRRSVPMMCTLLLAFGLLGTSAVAAQDSLVPVPPKGRGDACVEPTEVMRRNHMEFILHQRDDTVHRGIRTSKHSFKGCVDCHAVTNAEGRLARFDEPEYFCSGCHDYAAVKIDCFECHADRPLQTATDAMPESPARAGMSPRTVELLNGRAVRPAERAQAP